MGGMASAAAANDPVVEWNKVAALKTLTASPALAPVAQTRAMAIVQVSVHDAVNAITGAFHTYAAHGPAPSGASPGAAAIAAAHYALTALFPGQAADLDTRYADSLATHGIAAEDPGLEFGRSVAAAILALRAADGAGQAQFDYTVPNGGAPGVWERLGGAPALLPGWGAVAPWVLTSGSQFRPDPPPALDSEQYAKEYNEVFWLGRSTGSTRSDEQTQIALFWRASPTAIWNDVLNQVLAVRSFDLSTTARTFGLFYLAAADASIACWEAKYFYNFWRPMPAIRNGDVDGNDGTSVDPTWQSLLPTPPHPEFPSGHTANSGAMVFIMALLFGDAPGVPLEVTQFGIPRRWNTFSEGLAEVIEARIYSGIHFRTADVAGARLGRQVGRFVITHALRPSRPASAH